MTPAGFSRREFIGALAGGAVLGCVGPSSTGGSARISARPGTPTQTVGPGIVRLGSGEVGDGYLYVPQSYRADTAAPLVLGLHGAGGNYTAQFDLMGNAAEAHGMLLVGVNSTESTWDGISGRFGPDIGRINTALERAFARCRVDPARVVIEGFSDGASYALGVGVANGALFRRIVAFSPGFIAESASAPEGKPEVFISHGLSDQILPIVTSSRVIVPAMRNAGYQVTYTEFDGGHGVPASIRDDAVAWMIR